MTFILKLHGFYFEFAWIGGLVHTGETGLYEQKHVGFYACF